MDLNLTAPETQFRDELAGWLTSFGQYKGKSGGSDLPNWSRRI